ncbi:unnamed protein product [Blumeria hordei]|uniref:Uncharacterized protein n=1 Tax=Blumeria hordei TaxID=2867405 RepID=A0A383UP17_BLUHO|nr:unnamed protein product [Blumeria hordei]
MRISTIEGILRRLLATIIISLRFGEYQYCGFARSHRVTFRHYSRHTPLPRAVALSSLYALSGIFTGG